MTSFVCPCLSTLPVYCFSFFLILPFTTFVSLLPPLFPLDLNSALPPPAVASFMLTLFSFFALGPRVPSFFLPFAFPSTAYFTCLHPLIGKLFIPHLSAVLGGTNPSWVHLQNCSSRFFWVCISLWTWIFLCHIFSDVITHLKSLQLCIKWQVMSPRSCQVA